MSTSDVIPNWGVPPRNEQEPAPSGSDEFGDVVILPPTTPEATGLDPTPRSVPRDGPLPGTGSSSEIEAPPEALLGLDLRDAPRPSAGRSATPAPGPRVRRVGDDPDVERPEGRPSMLLVALASYASAVTLAFGWLWWSGRPRPEPPTDGPAPSRASGRPAVANDQALAPADDGQQADASALVTPSEPIPEGHHVAIGETLRIDALELSPMAVTKGRVELRRTRVDGSTERRRGGSDALRLRIRLRNASDDAIFAPLDEAFVREPDRRLPETFVEDRDGDRVYAYRLPVAGEWGIVGQDFPILRPGETTETVVATVADAADQLDGALRWRLRLRTAPDQTQVVGVSFDAKRIKADR